MEFRVEHGPIKSWLENVEADMAELKIDREDITAMTGEKRMNFRKRNSNPIGTQTKNR